MVINKGSMGVVCKDVGCIRLTSPIGQPMHFHQYIIVLSCAKTKLDDPDWWHNNFNLSMS